MNCHEPCGACCIAPEITTPLPNMPDGKPAGQACVNLGNDLRCKVYDIRPRVCREFQPQEYSCGQNHEQALVLIGDLEEATRRPF